MDVKSQIMKFINDRVDRVLDAAVEETISMLRKRVSTGQGADGAFSEYSELRKERFPLHKERRAKRGLQTDRKDFHFSGTMFSSLRETSRRRDASFVEAIVEFTGRAHRRDDQKPHHKGEPATNANVASWLGEQERGRSGNKSIIKLTDGEKESLLQKYNVIVND